MEATWPVKAYCIKKIPKWHGHLLPYGGGSAWAAEFNFQGRVQPVWWWLGAAAPVERLTLHTQNPALAVRMSWGSHTPISPVSRVCTVWRERQLELFSLEKRKLSEDLTFLYNHLLYCPEGGCSEVGFGFFSQANSDRRREESFELGQGRFRLDFRNNSSTEKTLEHAAQGSGGVTIPPVNATRGI